VDVLGIDVGKRDLHATLLQNDRVASKSVPNSAESRSFKRAEEPECESCACVPGGDRWLE
jgi:predicted rRNA methylase YqxC with S4 and FtsJ domains